MKKNKKNKNNFSSFNFDFYDYDSESIINAKGVKRSAKQKRNRADRRMGKQLARKYM